MDLICDSRFFWQARMVSYVQWDVLYLRLGYELRLRRLVSLTLAVFLAGVCATYFATGLHAGIDLWWPGFAGVAAAALVGGILAERWLFGRRMHRALVTDSVATQHSESEQA
jgi:hypothetical protein